MGGCCGNGFGWIGALFGGLLMLLFLGLLVVLAIWAIRALSRPHGGGFSGLVSPTGQSEDRALAVLKERYARGEIDRETYDRTKRDLSV